MVVYHVRVSTISVEELLANALYRDVTLPLEAGS
jgi:hypothetical protein